MPVWKRIRIYLLSNDYKFKNVADKSGITRNSFYKMMLGITPLPADYVIKIASAIGVSYKKFFEDKQGT